MNLKSFYLTAKLFIELFEGNDPVPLYQNLASSLTTMRNSPTADTESNVKQASKSIADCNRKFEDAFDKIPHSYLMIEIINAKAILGEEATKQLNDILANELYGASEKIQALAQKITAFKTQLQTIVNEFDKFGVEFSQEESPILSLELMGDYAVDNTDQLKTRLSEVESIVRAYSRLSDNPNAFAKPKILSISKSSPLIIDLGDGLTISTTLVLIAKGITWALDRVEQVNRIRLQSEDTKQKKMLTKIMEAEFKKQEEAEVSEKNIKVFIDTLYKDAKPSDKSGSETEIKKDLIEQTKLLINMVKGGANIKVFPSLTHDIAKKDVSESALDDFSLNMSVAYKKLNEQYEQIKLLEERVKSQPKPKKEKSEAKTDTKD